MHEHKPGEHIIRGYLGRGFHKFWYEYIDILDKNKYLLGCSLLLMNLGSRFVANEIGVHGTYILRTKLVRRFIVLCIFYLGTRDLFVSILLTGAFIIFIEYLFNRDSKYYIVPRKLDARINYEAIKSVTDEEYNKAKTLVRDYEKVHKNGEILKTELRDIQDINQRNGILL